MRLASILLLLGLPAAAQSNNSSWPLYGNLGSHGRTVSTVSDSAQLYFNEGMQFMYGFGTSSARRSFEEAQKHDPDCAMCHWGEAWALSPYLNGAMGTSAERNAYRAIQKARTLMDNAAPWERGLIEAFSVRFAEEPTSEMRRPLDTLYAETMAELSSRFPNDLDIGALYAESLMLLRPRRGSVDLNAPDVKRILPLLETVLARNIDHPGACHWYIHLVEASPEPARAEACADRLGAAIPGASHVQHMPSHIYMNIGRYGDGVRSNQAAWHVDQQAAYGGPPGIYPSHNLHMLLYGAVLDGQSAVAIQAAKDVAAISNGHGFYPVVTLAIFGRWQEVLDYPGPPDNEFHEGMWRFARGLARLRTEDIDAARKELRRVLAIIDEMPEDRNFRGHKATTLLGIPASILEGEIAASEERWDDAVAALERGVDAEDGLQYDEPEPWHYPVRHVLGAVLLDAGRPEDAERVYRDALKVLPNNGWALFGLEQALRAQGKAAEADAAKREFRKHWTRSDIWLRSSRF